MGGPHRPCKPCGGTGVIHAPHPEFGWPAYEAHPCFFCRGKGYTGGQPAGRTRRRRD